MQELQLMKPTIRAAINAGLDRPLVADLFFVLTEGEATPAVRPVPPVRRCATPPASVDLDALPEALRASFDGVLAAWRRRARS